MKKKKTGKQYLSLLLACLNEGWDDTLPDYGGLNLANRGSVRSMVADYIAPHYRSLTPSEQFRVKESLRYGLNFWPESDLWDAFPYESVVAVPPQMPVRELFRQIWYDLFDGEEPLIEHPEDYEEIPPC